MRSIFSTTGNTSTPFVLWITQMNATESIVRYLLWSVITSLLACWLTFAHIYSHTLWIDMMRMENCTLQTHKWVMCFSREYTITFTFCLHYRDLISCYEIALLDMDFFWCQNHIKAIVLQAQKHLHTENEGGRKHQIKSNWHLAEKWTWAWIYSSALFQ